MTEAQATSNQPIVDVQDLSVRFVSRDATVHAVNGVSFTLDPITHPPPPPGAPPAPLFSRSSIPYTPL